MKVDRDAYFTPDNIALACVQDFYKELPEFESCLVIEPSAGGGAFCRAFERLNKSYIAYDLMPMSDGILQEDFLSNLSPFPSDSVVIGNPPYGKNNSLVKEFVNRSFVRGARAVGFLLFSGAAAINFLESVNREVLYFKFIDEVNFVDSEGEVLLKTARKQSSLVPIFIVFGRKKLQKYYTFYETACFEDYDGYFYNGEIIVDDFNLVKHDSRRTRAWVNDNHIVELFKMVDFIELEKARKVLKDLKLLNSFSLRLSVDTLNFYLSNPTVFKGILSIV